MILYAYPRVTFGLKTFFWNKEINQPTFDSLFVLVNSVYDELHLEKSNNFSVVYYDKNNSELSMPNDLISQAVNYLENFHSVSVKLKIKVKKNIPLCSGLAGQAACAGALIKYYADALDLPINFAHAASKLDVNIPFFLTGFNVARVQNIGDHVTGYSGLKFPPVKLHFTNIKLDSKIVLEVHKTQKRFLESNYVSKLLNELVNGLPFDAINEYSNSIYKASPQLFLLHAKTKTWFNQVFPSGCGTTLVEIKDPYFLKHVASN